MNPGTAVGGADAYCRSTGQRSGGVALSASVNDELFSESLLGVAVRLTVESGATAPGCQVTVAARSVVVTAPAWPAWDTAEPIAGAGSGAASTAELGDELCAAEPPEPVAVTTSRIVAPMSSGVSA